MIASLPEPPLATLDERGYNISGRRHRRHRRADDRRAARHGRAPRSQGVHDPRHDGHGAERRLGDEPHPHRPGPEGNLHLALERRHDRCPDRVRHDRGFRRNGPEDGAPGSVHGAILNTDVAPTGEFQSNKNVDLRRRRIARSPSSMRSMAAPLFALHASKLATELTGDSIGTNILMLGYAAQQGLLPVSIASMQEAIRLNGTFVEGQLAHFRAGPSGCARAGSARAGTGRRVGPGAARDHR